MLKWLAIIGMSLWLANGARSQIPRNGSHEDQKPQQSAAHSRPSPPIAQEFQGHYGSTEQKKSTDPEPQGYHWSELLAPANIPAWCLVLVGFWAGLMAYRTLRSIDCQAEFLSNQTGLMRQQIDAMVNRERARLSLYAQPVQISGEGEFFHLVSCIEITNVGHSKGYISFSAGRFVVVPAGRWPLPNPDPDDLNLPDTVIKTSGGPMYTGFFIDDIPFTLGEFAESIANGTLAIYLYGFIEYESVGIKWHRDFGYVWSPPEYQGDSAPDSLEEMVTNGQWNDDVRQKTGEYEMKPN